ncbi:MAG: MBL fold metallo-hydrolase [Dehalococcoidia bacterium]|nr:MBL fold metallo-hydrolase [Dehalococcoidia bacterium]
MKIRMLGAHNLESRDTRSSTLLIDSILALDAGALTSTLTFEEQLALKAVLITHHHYDHIKDLVMLGATFYNNERQIHIYAPLAVYEAVRYLLQYPGKLYIDFLGKPEGDPTFKFTVVQPLKPFTVEQYEILAVPVSHSVPAVGYQVADTNGKKLFYTGDTGPGLDECWQHISPDLLVIENTASDRYIRVAREVKHMSPGLLKEELISFRKIKGYLPRIVTTHHFPHEGEEEERRVELEQLARELDASITIGNEGLELEL